MSVRDRRKPPFVWASTDALAHIEWAWNAGRSGKSVRRRVGYDVYVALLRIANGQKARANIGADASDRFTATQAEIAWLADVTVRTVEQVCEELERIGLLVVEADQDGNNRPGRPSFYTLVEPDQTYELSSYPSELSSYPRPHRRTKPVRTPSEASSYVSGERTNSVRTSLYKGKKKEKEERRSGGDGDQVIETDRAATAWSTAKQLLSSRLPADKFNRYIAPLEVAGERGERIVLVDSSEQGGGSWIEETARPLILEALDGFDDFEILIERDLEEDEPVPPVPSATRVNALATAPPHIQRSYPAVAESLGRVCELKRCPFPSTARIVAAMLTYPDADHRAVVSDMEDWLLEGTGARREVKDVIATFRGQLERKQHAARPPRPRNRDEHPADRRIRELRERGSDVVEADAVEEPTGRPAGPGGRE